MLKLKLQYFGHLMRRVDSLEKTLSWEGLRAGGEGDDRGWHGWMALLTWWMWVWVNSGSWMDREAWCAGIHGVAKSRPGLSNWTELKSMDQLLFYELSKMPVGSMWTLGQGRVPDVGKEAGQQVEAVGGTPGPSLPGCRVHLIMHHPTRYESGEHRTPPQTWFSLNMTNLYFLEEVS